MSKTPLLLRYRVLTSVLVLLALVVTGAAALYLPGHYSAESDVALIPSVSSSKPYGYNPYLAYSGALPMTAQILSYEMSDPTYVNKLRAAGYDQSFTVSLSPTAANGPIVTIAVTGGNKTAVEATLVAVTKDVSAELALLQNGISARNRITLLPVSTDTAPTLSISKTARPLAMVLAAGLVLAFAVPRLVRSSRAGNAYARHRLSDESAAAGERDTLAPEARAGYQYAGAPGRHDPQSRDNHDVPMA